MISSTDSARPFLKWPGGKWSIAPQIAALLPHDLQQRIYYEPFLGGGSMFFYLRPPRAVLSDVNEDLIATYYAVRDCSFHVATRVRDLYTSHTAEQYYAIRDAFNRARAETPSTLAERVQRAAWLIYLNHACFNGLYRTNAKGEFNSPDGKRKTLRLDERALRLASVALDDVTIVARRYSHALSSAEPGDVIYLDPPYVPLNTTASFTAYAGGSWSEAEHRALAELYRDLDRRGCLLALSNNYTPLVRELYAGFDFTPIAARRSISARGGSRRVVQEVLVRNLGSYPRADAPRQEDPCC